MPSYRLTKNADYYIMFFDICLVSSILILLCFFITKHSRKVAYKNLATRLAYLVSFAFNAIFLGISAALLIKGYAYNAIIIASAVFMLQVFGILRIDFLQTNNLKNPKMRELRRQKLASNFICLAFTFIFLSVISIAKILSTIHAEKKSPAPSKPSQITPAPSETGTIQENKYEDIICVKGSTFTISRD